MDDLFQETPSPEEMWRMLRELQEVVYGRAEKAGRTAPRLQVPDALREAWARWDAYRATGKKWTADAKRINLTALEKHSGGRSDLAALIVERSIGRGWTGLFELPPEAIPKAAPKTFDATKARNGTETKEEQRIGYLRQQAALYDWTPDKLAEEIGRVK